MKNLLKIILMLILILCHQSKSFAKIQNKIVLKVNNEIITDYELKNKILSLIMLSGEELNQKNINKLKKPALDSLIQHKLKKIELSKYKIKTNNNQIQNYLLSVSSNNIENFKKNFGDNNLSFQLYLDEVETQFKWQNLIYKLYSNKIDVDENSINEDLKNLIKSESSIEEYKIAEIEISINPNNSIKEQVEDIKNLIETIGFEKTALQYSVATTAPKNGDLGWVNSKFLSPSIYKIVSKLQVGEISKPITKQSNIVFFKLSDKKFSSINNINVNELKQKLIDQKKNELFNLYSRSHLSKLKNSSLIEFK